MTEKGDICKHRISGLHLLFRNVFNSNEATRGIQCASMERKSKKETSGSKEVWLSSALALQ